MLQTLCLKRFSHDIFTYIEIFDTFFTFRCLDNFIDFGWQSLSEVPPVGNRQVKRFLNICFVFDYMTRINITHIIF